MVSTQEELVQNLSLKTDQIADLIKRFGHPPAVILLDPSCSLFSIPSVIGFIGYRLEFKHAVVISDPVCAKEDQAELAFAFHEYCRQQKWDVIYILVSQEFSQWAIQNVGSVLIQSGDELVIDPDVDPTKGRRGEKLRWKINHAHQHHIKVEEYKGNDAQMEKALDQAVKTWVKLRTGPQIYLGTIELFANRQGSRWFYAKQGNEIVGVLQLKQLEICHGWAMSFLMALPDAPAGTSEVLVLHVIEKLRDAGCHFLSLGAGSGKQLGEIKGLNPVITTIARRLFKVVNWFFPLQCRRRYFNKFLPESRPTYLVFSNPTLGISALRALMRVLNISI